MSQTEAQKRAQQKYNHKNKLKRRITSYRTSARTFIRHYATDQDLDEFSQLLKERRRINQLLKNLDKVRALMNKSDFFERTGVHIEIWRRPKDVLNHRKEENILTSKWEKWFENKIEPKFNPEEPVVEIKRNGKSKFYNGNQASNILDWLY